MADETTTTEPTTEAATTVTGTEKPAATTTAKPTRTETSTTSSGSDYDWRGAIAGEDKKLAKRLERFDSLSTFGKSYFEADARLNSGKMVPLLGEDATDEDRAAFNKTLGIPDDPKKYEITVKPPEGLELSDTEKGRLDAITAALHKAGGFMAHPSVVNEAHRIFYAEREEAEAQMVATATIQKQKTEEFLSKIWPGQEKKRNLMFAEQAIGHFFGKDFAEIKDMQMADGTRLGDHVEFIQAMAKVGRMTMEDPVFLEAGRNGVNAADALAKEKETIMSWRSTNRAKYNSPETQRRLAEIYAAEARHQERGQQAQ